MELHSSEGHQPLALPPLPQGVQAALGSAPLPAPAQNPISLHREDEFSSPGVCVFLPPIAHENADGFPRSLAMLASG